MTWSRPCPADNCPAPVHRETERWWWRCTTALAAEAPAPAETLWWVHLGTTTTATPSVLPVSLALEKTASRIHQLDCKKMVALQLYGTQDVNHETRYWSDLNLDLDFCYIKKVTASHTRYWRWAWSWSQCTGSQPAGDCKSSTRR